MATRKIETKYPNLDPPKYSVRYDCANCGWSGTIKFDKGMRAPTTTTCPTCEVSGAKKAIVLPYMRREPVVPVPLIPNDTPPWPRELPRPYPILPEIPYNPLGPCVPTYTPYRPSWLGQSHSGEARYGPPCHETEERSD